MRVSSTELYVLGALEQEAELYGAQIAESIKQQTSGDRVIRKGTLYTTLHRMKEKGLVSSRWGDDEEVVAGARRKYYKITALGYKSLNEIRTTVSKPWARLISDFS